MGYDIYFKFKNDKDKIKYTEYCEKKKIDSELFWTCGWDKRNLGDYFKNLGKSKVKKSADNQFEWRYWVLKVSDLKDLSDTYTFLKNSGIIGLIDTYPDDSPVDIVDWFYNKILGFELAEKAEWLENDMSKYESMNTKNVKEVRLADLEYSEQLRNKFDKTRNNFYNKLNFALDKSNEDIKYFIREDLPCVFWDLERIDEMYKTLLKVVNENTELLFNESY